MSAAASKTSPRYSLPALARSPYTLATLWTVALAVSWRAITAYEFTAEQPLGDGYAVRWPLDSEVPRTAGKPSLILFLHPKCPCSRASLGELERLLQSIGGTRVRNPQVTVVVTIPKSHDEWLKSDTVTRAQKLPNVWLFVDADGVEAARFGAVTSGAVMLFDEAGVCRYAGGVTMSRGHEGDNAGRLAVAKILEGKLDAARGIPAFGCRLCLPETEAPLAPREST